MQARNINRRQFIAQSSTIAASTVVPMYVLGGPAYVAPSEQLNVAVIGTGGQGIVNIQRLLKHRDVKISAICDVAGFWDNTELYYRHHGGRGPALQAIEAHYRQNRSEGKNRSGCTVYVDFRKMLEKSGQDIDAVLIAAPNHIHAIATVTAMRAGKGVYCEKPLTYSIYESRQVAAVARETRVATQMGNHGHSSDDIRRAVEWVRDGAIGQIREVFCWAPENKLVKFHERPQETPPIPEGLNWDLWLGPAPQRPFHPDYAPQNWHYWWDFGGGKLGNFGCHVLDTAVWALDLEHPTFVEASSTQLNKETTPQAAACHYRFPARGDQPPVGLYWCDGGIKPPRPDCLELRRNLPHGGSLLVGERGAILSEMWSGSPRIIPEKQMRAYRQPSASIPRSRGPHRDWIDACKGGPPASSNFANAARLNEIVLLGVAAIRTGRPLQWDGPNMKVTNTPQVESIIRGHIRKGWEI